MVNPTQSSENQHSAQAPVSPQRHHHSPKKPPKRWHIIVYLLILVGILISWAVYTSRANAPITDKGAKAKKIQGNGIFMSELGRLFSINTRVDGVVNTLEVKPGDEIKKGQIVAIISDHEYDSKLAKAEIELKNLTDELNQLKDQIAKESQAQLTLLRTQLAASEYNVKQIDKRIDEIKQDLERKQILLNKGLISPATVVTVEDSLSAARVEKEQAKSTIAEIRFNLLKGYRTDDTRSKEKEVTQAAETLDLLKSQQHRYKVASPWDGLVLELKVAEGEIVSRSQSLILIERNQRNNSTILIFSYFPVEQGKRVLVGQMAKIVVSTVNTKQYGFMSGKVISVSKFSVSNDSLSKRYYNSELINYLTNNKTVIQAVIQPDVDPVTKEFKWTLGKTPPVPITTGTVCTVTIGLDTEVDDVP